MYIDFVFSFSKEFIHTQIFDMLKDLKDYILKFLRFLISFIDIKC